MQVETLKLSTLVMTVTPELYSLLTKEELEADVMIQGDIGKLKREDVNRIIASAIEQNVSTPYH